MCNCYCFVPFLLKNFSELLIICVLHFCPWSMKSCSYTNSSGFLWFLFLCVHHWETTEVEFSWIYLLLKREHDIVWKLTSRRPQEESLNYHIYVALFACYSKPICEYRKTISVPPVFNMILKSVISWNLNLE